MTPCWRCCPICRRGGCEQLGREGHVKQLAIIGTGIGTTIANVLKPNPALEYRRRVIFSLLKLSNPGSGVRLLDIGSGQGDLAAAVRTRFPSAQLLGLELSQSGVEISRQKVRDARFVQRNLLEKIEVPEDQRGWATHAVCSEVLGHRG